MYKYRIDLKYLVKYVSDKRFKYLLISNFHQVQYIENGFMLRLLNHTKTIKKLLQFSIYPFNMAFTLFLVFTYYIIGEKNLKIKPQ